MSIKKECGDCTLCCTILPIVEMESPPNVICQHCTTKCEIYDTRPTACENFNCLWIEDEEMSDDLKPNKINIIFEKITDKVYLGNLHKDHLGSWQNPDVIKYMRDLNDSGISVIVSSFTNHPKLFMVSDGRTQEEVMGEAMVEFNKEFRK